MLIEIKGVAAMHLFCCLLVGFVFLVVDDKPKVEQTVSDEAGKHRLQLRVTITEQQSDRGIIYAQNFHSLVWEESDDIAWKQKAIITREQFEADRERWVGALQALRAKDGVAVLKMAESEPTDNNGSTRVVYSWCEWDLVKNQKLKTIKVCKEPFEPFESIEVKSPMKVSEALLGAQKQTSMYKVLEEARQLAEDGKYDEALQKHLYYHENSLKDFTQTGVRLSFALSYWAELGKKHPPALEALLQQQKKMVALFEAGKADPMQITEIIAIHTALNKKADNIAFFKKMHQEKPKTANLVYHLLEADLLANKEYELCSHYLKNPLNKMSQYIWSYKSLASRTQPGLAFLQEETSFAEKHFTQRVCELLELLVRVDRKVEADQVKEKALTVLNTPEMRAAMDKAMKSAK
jgi:hypothetical protein